MTQLHELHEYFRISMEKSSFYFKWCISKCPQSQQNNQWRPIPRPAICQWLAMFTPLKSKIELLTTWHTFWRQMCFLRQTNFLLSWSILDFMTTFLHHDIFLTSWQTFDVMTNVFTSWRVFDFMTHFLTSWCLFDILTNLF